jgi:two-component system CheB/CheR fusion protein
VLLLNGGIVSMETANDRKAIVPASWLAGQTAAFKAAMNGASLASSLDILIGTAMQQCDVDRRCAFYIADGCGGLHHVTGMSPSYASCVDGFPIGEDSLACGLAVGTGCPVITPDVFEEPKWRPWLNLAISFNYRGCWSFPVETADGQMVGSFAMYFRQPHRPTEFDRKLAAVLCDTAAIIISHHFETEQRRRLSEELRCLNQANRGHTGP